MKLHRAIESDWSKLEVSENAWQKVAAGSHGIITIGNFVSVTGLILVTVGLIFLYTKNIWLAITLLIVGRLADLLDGIVADWTKTKSPVGEAFDATIDKIEICLTIIALWAAALMPIVLLILLTLHTVFNIGIFTAAHFKNQRIHPTRSGKIAVACQWATISLFVILNSFTLDSVGHSLISVFAYLFFIAFIGLGVISSFGYTKDLND